MMQACLSGWRQASRPAGCRKGWLLWSDSVRTSDHSQCWLDCGSSPKLINQKLQRPAPVLGKQGARGGMLNCLKVPISVVSGILLQGTQVLHVVAGAGELWQLGLII